MRFLIRPFAGLFLLSLAAASAHAETAYFVLTGTNLSSAAGTSPYQAFVVSSNDPALIKQARDALANPSPTVVLGISAKVATGADGINRDYAAPGHPVWSWHITQLLKWNNLAGPAGVMVATGYTDGPSNVSDMLAGIGIIPVGSGIPDTVNWVGFTLSAEITPGKSAAVVNVSARGVAGTGDNVLIVGFIVQGAEPRNIVLRALGPTLTNMGVSGVLADPKIALYRGSTKIAENDNWADGSFTPALLPDQTWLTWLYPTSAKESALYVCLPPGAYTMIVSGVNNTSGVVLADVHDVDALKPQ